MLLGPPRREAVAAAVEAPLPMRAAVVALARRLRRARASRRACSSARSSGSRRGRTRAPTHVGLDLPGHRLAADRRDRASRSSRSPARSSLLRGRRAPRPRRRWACGQLVEPALEWTSAGFTKPLRLVLEAVLRPQREIVVRATGGVVQEVVYSGHVPHLIDEHALPAGRRALALAARARTRAGCRAGSLGTYVAYLLALVVVLLALRGSG